MEETWLHSHLAPFQLALALALTLALVVSTAVLGWIRWLVHLPIARLVLARRLSLLGRSTPVTTK